MSFERKLCQMPREAGVARSPALRTVRGDHEPLAPRELRRRIEIRDFPPGEPFC